VGFIGFELILLDVVVFSGWWVDLVGSGGFQWI